MVKFLDYTYWLYQTIAMLLTCYLIPRLRVNGVFPALMTVVVLAFVNSHLWSAALFYEIPDTLTNRTLILLCANAGIFWVIVKILPGIEVDGVLPALVAPIVFTIISLLIGYYAPTIDWAKMYEEAKEIAGEGQSRVQETRDFLQKTKDK